MTYETNQDIASSKMAVSPEDPVHRRLISKLAQAAQERGCHANVNNVAGRQFGEIASKNCKLNLSMDFASNMLTITLMDTGMTKQRKLSYDWNGQTWKRSKSEITLSTERLMELLLLMLVGT